MRFSHPTHGHDERRRHGHGDDGHHRRGFGRRSGHPGSDEPDALELARDHGGRHGRTSAIAVATASAATASMAKDAAAGGGASSTRASCSSCC